MGREDFELAVLDVGTTQEKTVRRHARAAWLLLFASWAHARCCVRQAIPDGLHRPGPSEAAPIATSAIIGPTSYIITCVGRILTLLLSSRSTDVAGATIS